MVAFRFLPQTDIPSIKWWRTILKVKMHIKINYNPFCFLPSSSSSSCPSCLSSLSSPLPIAPLICSSSSSFSFSSLTSFSFSLFLFPVSLPFSLSPSPLPQYYHFLLLLLLIYLSISSLSLPSLLLSLSSSLYNSPATSLGTAPSKERHYIGDWDRMEGGLRRWRARMRVQRRA